MGCAIDDNMIIIHYRDGNRDAVIGQFAVLVGVIIGSSGNIGWIFQAPDDAVFIFAIDILLIDMGFEISPHGEIAFGAILHVGVSVLIHRPKTLDEDGIVRLITSCKRCSNQCQQEINSLFHIEFVSGMI